MGEGVKYVAINSPSLTLKLAGKRYKAVDGVFVDLPPAAEAELDKMLSTMPHIRAEVRKLDIAAAEEVARKYLANKPPAAVRGVVTSSDQASAKLREAKKQQERQTLTGSLNPLNISTNVKDDKPLDVTEVPHTKPSTSRLGKRS